MQLVERALSTAAVLGAINISPTFNIQSQDAKLKDQNASDPSPSLGLLSTFTGSFTGNGFNTIFRPNSGGSGGTSFPQAVTPAPPTAPNNNVLELNLIQESLQFSGPLGSVPNRGFNNQGDIFLNGVSYLQIINDVTNPDTGRADGSASGIHFEPGLWMHVPATGTSPVLGETVARMGSVPHGTTFTAQSLTPSNSSSTTAGPPTIPSVDITPFLIGVPASRTRFPSQTASNGATARLPQDLTSFMQAGSITQAILDDPNSILRTINKGLTITNTVEFTISTNLQQQQPSTAGVKGVSGGGGGGTDNIAFLAGNNAIDQNALVPSMTATYWLETVRWTVPVPAGTKQGQTVMVSPDPPAQGAAVPVFAVTPPRDVTGPLNVSVSAMQIQYSQVVLLNFAGESWPHVTVNSLVPAAPIVVGSEAF